LLAAFFRETVKAAGGGEGGRDAGLLGLKTAGQKEPLAEALAALPDSVAEALAALPEPGPTPDEKKLLEEKLEEERKAEEERKQALEEKLEQERNAEEQERKQAFGEKLEQERNAEKERKQAEPREKTSEEKIRKEPAPKKKQYHGEPVAALLNKMSDKSAQLTGASTPRIPTKAKGATAGAADGRDSQLVQGAVLGVMMKQAVGRCWNANSGLGGANRAVVEVEVRLRPDGRLMEAPRVLNSGLGPVFADAASRAVHAIERCEPYDLPMGLYQGGWDHMVVTFDPQWMFRNQKL
jgi:colicin import membrane protein